jgi:HAD superfamily hydrolase (TIGR01549 family)
MAIRGVIFDMDGTITAPYLEFARFKTVAGIGDADTLDYLRSATGAEYERVHGLLMKFEEDGVANAKLNRGARTLLAWLKRRRIPIALLTRNSRKSVDGVCRRLKLEFDVIYTREDGPHKPAPEPIRAIARRWRTVPAELLVVGDYKWDLLCARNAGAPCAVLVTADGAPEWACGADFIITKLSELVGIVQERLKDETRQGRTRPVTPPQATVRRCSGGCRTAASRGLGSVKRRPFCRTSAELPAAHRAAATPGTVPVCMRQGGTTRK